MTENFEWFKEHYNEIFQLCGECYVVINNKRIIRIFDTYGEACHWADDNNLLGKVNVQYCNGDESGYTAYVN